MARLYEFSTHFVCKDCKQSPQKSLKNENLILLMTEKDNNRPGIGIRSIKVTNLFRAVNFELYVRPNIAVMIIGSAVMLGCLGYIGYMRHKYEGLGYYSAVNEDGSEQFVKKRSRWD